ncbi:MAG: type III ribulose-bisphosphate carboxylase [Candidatus Diapherotrites archaeon]|nr:type III ribulose-bisphosphate carboxylase [Candidatus Diapherotrites archaeon]
MGYEGFVHPDYAPDTKDLVVAFRVKPAKGVSMQKACENLAGESSVGTWTDVKTMKKGIAEKLSAKVYSIKGEQVKVAYPIDLFEPGNMPQVLSSIAGNIYGMKVLDSLRIEDIYFPPKMDKSFLGPKYGVPGVRKLLRVNDRPLVGTIVKPKVGLDWQNHAQVSYDAWVGGLDLVKDDENLSSQRFNPFEKRVVATLKARDKAEKETGERKMYMPNITAETSEMLRRAEFVKKQGGEYAMIDIITCGWSAVQTVREANQDLNMVLHAHRAMHAALTRNKYHGMSMLAVAKIARLIGVDQLHIGTAVGKMEGGPEEVVSIEKEIEGSFIPADTKHNVLAEDWGHIRPVLAVASGGLHPGMVPKLVKLMGKDVVIQMGGGVHGHPKGTRKGAEAARAAVEAASEGVALNEAAKKNKALAEAIGLWGVLK